MTVGYAVFSVRDRERARAALQGALKADYENLPRMLPEFSTRAAALRSTLEEARKRQDNASSRTRGRRNFALSRLADPRCARFLFDRLLAAGPAEVKVIGEALAARPEEAGIDMLRRVLLDESAEPGARLRVACALAKIEPPTADSWTTIAAPLAEALLAEDRRALERWIDQLGPAVRSWCRTSARSAATRHVTRPRGRRRPRPWPRSWDAGAAAGPAGTGHRGSAARRSARPLARVGERGDVRPGARLSARSAGRTSP